MRSYSTLGDMSEIRQEAERVTSGVWVIVDLSAMLRGQFETLLVNRFQEPAAHFLLYLEARPDDAVAFLFIKSVFGQLSGHRSGLAQPGNLANLLLGA
jgi:hypothetical protein